MSQEQQEAMEAEARKLLECLPSAIRQERIYQIRKTKDDGNNSILEIHPTRGPLRIRIPSDEKTPRPNHTQEDSIAEIINISARYGNTRLGIRIDGELQAEIITATAEVKARTMTKEIADATKEIAER